MKRKAEELVVCVIFFALLLLGCNAKTELTLAKSLEFEVNSKISVSSLVENIKNGEIINADELVDTSKLGEKEVSVQYLDSKKQEVTYDTIITVVDTTAPVITCNKTLTVTAGADINLFQDVVVTDNSGEEITPTINGDYNVKKEGVYKLQFVAVDSSGNRATEDFTLVVNDTYKQLLKGDFSGVAGKYVNRKGKSITLLPNGLLSIDNKKSKVSDITAMDQNAPFIQGYWWAVDNVFDKNGKIVDGGISFLFPIGTKIECEKYHKDLTKKYSKIDDTSKIRLVYGANGYPEPDYVYFKQ